MSPLLGTSTSESTEKLGKSSIRRSPERPCYEVLLREDAPSSLRKSRNTVSSERRGCYGNLLRDLPKGMLRRGRKLYYRHTVPADAQRLLNRLEVWRSLRTDSLAVARRRLPSVVARIEAEIEQPRAVAGLTVDATLILPLRDDLAEQSMEVNDTPAADPRLHSALTLAEAYRSYIDDPTRAWTATPARHRRRSPNPDPGARPAQGRLGRERSAATVRRG